MQKLAKDYSGFKYYSAKGLVLMAKNFYALNDAFQATYILESVIENFKTFEEVVEEAKTELKGQLYSAYTGVNQFIHSN